MHSFLYGDERVHVKCRTKVVATRKKRGFRTKRSRIAHRERVGNFRKGFGFYYKLGF